MGTGESERAAGASGTGRPEEPRPGPLLGSGRTADIYAVGAAGADGGSWVLRRYRDGLDASGEAVVMAYLHSRGYPVPELRPPGPGGDLRPTDLVMRRLTGPTLAESLVVGRTTPAEAGAMLAELLRRLHEIPSRGGVGSILHLDLHPENVILTADGPVVIDWSNCEEGDPGLDRAVSALILAQVVVGDSGHPREPVRAVLKTLLERAPVSRETLAEAHARRRANPTMSPAELAQLDDAVALIGEMSPAGG
ncbi:phosphotransferase [Streptomyces sp. DW26H14]|uniref:phosphotransferase n=1 Tax=Streptomyces sp. DW26H14 TaxID=3435395 RepID=UPI00403D828D